MWLVDETSFACWRPVMKIVGLHAVSFGSDTSSLAVGLVISSTEMSRPRYERAGLVRFYLRIRRELADDRFALVGADDVIPGDERFARTLSVGARPPLRSSRSMAGTRRSISGHARDCTSFNPIVTATRST